MMRQCLQNTVTKNNNKKNVGFVSAECLYHTTFSHPPSPFIPPAGFMHNPSCRTKFESFLEFKKRL